MSNTQQEGRTSLTTDGCTKGGMSTYLILFYSGLGLIIVISVLALLSLIPSIAIFIVDINHLPNLIVFFILVAVGIILMVIARNYHNKCQDSPNVKPEWE